MEDKEKLEILVSACINKVFVEVYPQKLGSLLLISKQIMNLMV